MPCITASDGYPLMNGMVPRRSKLILGLSAIVYPENWTGGFVRMAVPRSGRRKAEDGTVQAAQRGVQGVGGAGIDQGAADGERDRRRVRGASRADRPVEEADAGGVAGALLLQEGQGGS